MDTTPGPDPGDGDPGAADRSDVRPDGPDGMPDGIGADGATDAADADGATDAADADSAAEAADEPVGSDPLRFNQWMKRSATGAVLSGIALGLQQALEPKRNLPAFVMEAPGEPEDPDAPITLHFDPDDPTKTVAVVRSTRPTPPGATEPDP